MGNRVETDEQLLAQANELDASYAAADAFDTQQFNKWVEANFVLFCKRTDYPKLGYIIHRLNEAGIASILHGRSFHAPCLYVAKDCEDAAWGILSAPYHGKTSLDDLPDDLGFFRCYTDTQPDTDLYG